MAPFFNFKPISDLFFSHGKYHLLRCIDIFGTVLVRIQSFVKKAAYADDCDLASSNAIRSAATKLDIAYSYYITSFRE